MIFKWYIQYWMEIVLEIPNKSIKGPRKQSFAINYAWFPKVATGTISLLENNNEAT